MHKGKQTCVGSHKFWIIKFFCICTSSLIVSGCPAKMDGLIIFATRMQMNASIRVGFMHFNQKNIQKVFIMKESLKESEHILLTCLAFPVAIGLRITHNHQPCKVVMSCFCMW